MQLGMYGSLHMIAAACFRKKQRIYFLAQLRIAVAGFVQQSSALICIALGSAMK